MAPTVTAYLRDFHGSNPQPQEFFTSDTEFSFELVVHARARTLYRQGPGETRVLVDSTAPPVTGAIKFPARLFGEEGMMKRLLGRALGQDQEIFHVSATDITNYVRMTRSLDLRAEIEVVVDRYEDEQDPIEVEEEEMGPVEEEEWIGAIEMLKERCVFDSGERVLGTCSVCLEDLSGDGLFRAPCSHLYHASCIESWLMMKKKSSCPLCRGLLFS